MAERTPEPPGEPAGPTRPNEPGLGRRTPGGRTWTPGGWVVRRPGDFDFVTPRVATGGALWDEADARAVLDAGITHVVTAARELEDDVRRLLAGRAVHLANGTWDDGTAKRTAWFARSITFSIRALEGDPNARVLLHCGAGINRGPSAAYAVLRALGHDPEEAYELITAARPFAGIIYANDAEAAVSAIRARHGRRR
jgi:dual specificity phosphatase 3